MILLGKHMEQSDIAQLYMKNEIHFSYNGKGYWIAHTSDGLSHLSDDLGNTQMFNSCRDLFENARIDGSTLEEIWGKVIVDSC